MRLFRKSDRKEVDEWRKRHLLPAWTSAMYPRLGFIEPGVAVVFLYLCEGGLGLVEGLLTNPDAPSEARHKAFSDGWRMLTAEAKAAGVRRLIALTANFASTKRSVDPAGFEVQTGVLVSYRSL